MFVSRFHLIKPVRVRLCTSGCRYLTHGAFIIRYNALDKSNFVVKSAMRMQCVARSLYLLTTVALMFYDKAWAAWRSGNALDSNNVVTLRRARVVPGWVTIFGRVNHPGVEPGTQVDSA